MAIEHPGSVEPWVINTFTAKIDHSRSNFSIVLFQLRQENCTAASVHAVDFIFIPFIVYYAYVAI
jgi:hypothetical protein